ncbi:MAG: hypothetical protein AB9903_19895 [Vulcanimicrobiota bacterium]
MASSPFELGIFIAAALVFLIVICLILTSIRKLKPFLYIIALLSLIAVIFIVKSLIAMNGCVENVRALNSALAKYKFSKGTYPDTISSLSPDFIKKIPVCPSAGKDTYAPGYKATHDGRECSFSCKGKNHDLIVFTITLYAKQDYPNFNSARDLKERVNIKN